MGLTRQSRKNLDPAARAGLGFPVFPMLLAIAAITANATDLDRVRASAYLDTSAKDGSALLLVEANVHIGSLGTGGASGNNTFKLVVCDDAGNLLRTIATIPIAYNVSTAVVDLRDSNGKGYAIYPGENIRLDTGTLAGSLSVNPSAIKVHLTAECYGIAA